MTVRDDLEPVTEHSGIALTLAQTLDARGFDSSKMFRQAGIDPALTKSPDNRIKGEAMQRLWTIAVEATQNDALGIEFAESFRAGALHGLGFSFSVSNTLNDSFERLVRYFRVICNVGDAVVQERGSQVRLWLKLPVQAGIAVDEGIDAGLALFLKLCRNAKGPDFNAEWVELQRPTPKNTTKFEQFFRCPIKYEAPENVLIFRRKELETRLPLANAALARASDHVVVEYLRQNDQNNVVGQVRARIIEALPSGTPTQQLIAADLHQSPRSLQRKLAEANTTFSKLIDEVRYAMARQYLSESHRSIGEISYLLGYSEPGNFARSFKGWAGQTPNQFRTEQLT